MQLEELRKYKEQLMKDLLSSDRIVQLLDENVAPGQGYSLAYKRVFPYEYLPETIDHGRTYICFDVDLQRTYDPKKTYHKVILRIWVFTHKSLLRLPEGGIRVDEICYEISNLVNGSRFYGLGEIRLGALDRFAPVSDHQGKVLTFYATDVSKFYNPHTQAPKNRRVGE